MLIINQEGYLDTVFAFQPSAAALNNVGSELLKPLQLCGELYPQGRSAHIAIAFQNKYSKHI